MSAYDNTIRIEAERRIDALAATVYEVIADYRQHHSHILPPAFSNFVVESGGVGAGTVITFDLRAGGQTQHYRARIDEPEPGRVLREVDRERGTVTTFDVRPDGDGAHVRIRTELRPSGGLRGWMERRFAPRMLAPLYDEELTLLDRYVRERMTVLA